jgi:hypothetical protein
VRNEILTADKTTATKTATAAAVMTVVPTAANNGMTATTSMTAVRISSIGIDNSGSGDDNSGIDNNNDNLATTTATTTTMMLMESGTLDGKDSQFKLSVRFLESEMAAKRAVRVAHIA